MMKRLIWVMMFLLLATSPTGALAQDQSAQVRVVHASPDAPNVDVLINDDTVFSNVTFNQVTAYTPVSVGSISFKVTPAGQGGSVLSEVAFNLEAGQEYTVVIAGKQALLEPVLLEDNNTLPPAGQVRLRFMHASPNAPALDLTLANGSLLFGNVPFKNTGNYISLDAGTYDLQVQIAGTGVAAATASEVTLAGGTVYTIFATGLAGGIPELQFLISVDASQAAAVAATPTAAASATVEASATMEASATTEASATMEAEQAAAVAATPTVVVSATMEAAQTPAGEATPTAMTAPTGVATDEGIEPGVMPTTGGEDNSLIQSVLLGLGLVMVVAALAMGFRSFRKPVDLN
jgi:hypothetical protein